jgi:hypothetical protein
MQEPAPYQQAQWPEDELREAQEGLAPPDVFDPVIEAYKKDVDRTLLRENLKLTMAQRAEKFLSFMKSIYAARGQANSGLKVWR